MIMDGDEELNRVELDFFLKGNTSLDVIEARCPFKWISVNGWKDLHRLVHVGEAFQDVIKDLTGNGDSWKKWYDNPVPESADMPNNYSESLNKF